MPTATEQAEQIMEGQPYADPALGGINDAFDKLFDQQDPVPSAPAAPHEPPVTPESADAPESPQKTEKASTEAKKPIEIKEIKIDDDFFTDDEPVKEEVHEDKTGFDEEAFDKETEEATKGMEAKAGDKFKALRQELKEAKQKTITPEVEKKLSELEMKAAEADGLRQRMEELAIQSAKIKVETSDEFDKEVRKPVDDLYVKAEELAGLYEGDPKLLWAIVTERDRKKQNDLIKEHLGEFSDFDRSEVYRMSQDFSGLLIRRQAMLDEADKYIQKIEADKVKQTEIALEEHKKTVQTFQRDIWRKYKDVIPGFTDDDGKETPEFRALMNRSMSLDFSRATPRDQAFAAFSGVILKHMVGQVNALRRQLAEYEAGDERAIKARPGTGGSVSASAAAIPSAGEKSFIDRFAEAELS
jgi:hypothetical protein